MFPVSHFAFRCKFTGPHFLVENIVAPILLDKLSKVTIKYKGDVYSKLRENDNKLFTNTRGWF